MCALRQVVGVVLVAPLRLVYELGALAADTIDRRLLGAAAAAEQSNFAATAVAPPPTARARVAADDAAVREDDDDGANRTAADGHEGAAASASGAGDAADDEDEADDDDDDEDVWPPLGDFEFDDAAAPRARLITAPVSWACDRSANARRARALLAAALSLVWEAWVVER